jgi:cytochrome c556
MLRAPHWILGLLIATGCQHFDRASECRAIARSVNPELKTLAETLGKRSPFSREEYRSASAKYARSARQLEALHPLDAELGRLARELRDNMLALSRSCDRFAAAEKGQGPWGDPTATHDLENLWNRHHSLVTAVDRHCIE